MIREPSLGRREKQDELKCGRVREIVDSVSYKALRSIHQFTANTAGT
jgi:hypothetical protein